MERICKIIQTGTSLGIVIPIKIIKDKKLKKGDYIKTKFMEKEEND